MKIVWLLLIFTFTFLVKTFTFGQTNCPLKSQGDANCDGLINLIDYEVWRREYSGTSSATDADFSRDNIVNLIDYEIWRRSFIGGTVNPPTTTPIRTTPTANPTSGPSITLPPITSGQGIWISKEEIARLPISGQSGCSSFCASAWNAIVSLADSSWGTPNLSDYAGLGHSQGIWAGAIAATKFSTMPGREADAQKYYNKVIQNLNSVMGTETASLPSSGGGKNDGSLAITRQFPRYVIAADLLEISNWGSGYKGFSNYVDYMLHTNFTFRVGDGGATFSKTHDDCGSNGNAMAGAARIASAAYLKDRSELDRAWTTFRRYTGDGSVGPNICLNSAGQTWFYGNYNSTPHVGINPKGASCNSTNYPADGVIPADQGRGGNCPSSGAPGYTQYPWEGLQGVYGQALILYRLGYKDGLGRNPFQTNDNALYRAVQYQWNLQNSYGGGWYDSGRAAWVKHLAYKFYGFKPIQYDATDGGRNFSNTQWTHQ